MGRRVLGLLGDRRIQSWELPWFLRQDSKSPLPQSPPVPSPVSLTEWQFLPWTFHPSPTTQQGRSYIPALQMRKLRLREMKWLIQGQTLGSGREEMKSRSACPWSSSIPTTPMSQGRSPSSVSVFNPAHLPDPTGWGLGGCREELNTPGSSVLTLQHHLFACLL